MKRGIGCSALALMVLSAFTPAGYAATKKPVPKKPPVKRVVQGTKQLSGDQAVFGKEFTLGKAYPMNFQLDRVEYSTARLRIGEQDFMPEVTEKFVLLYFTIHNPQPREALFRGDTFTYTVVDDTDTNRDARNGCGIVSNKQPMGIQLKPGQKLAGYTFIRVPASAVVPKLVVKSNDNLVLRYDLRGKIKPLAGPVLDPAGPAGAGALKLVPASFGTPYQMCDVDATFETPSTSTEAIRTVSLQNDEQFLIMPVTVTNALLRPIPLRADTFTVHAVDADGIESFVRVNLIRASSTEPLPNTTLSPGNPVRVRLFGKVPKNVAIKELRITSGPNMRSFSFGVNALP